MSTGTAQTGDKTQVFLRELRASGETLPAPRSQEDFHTVTKTNPLQDLELFDSR